MTKQDIEKLNAHLKKGDQKAIAELTGLSKITVNKFFNGNDDNITDENISLIVNSASILIKKRKRLKAASEKIINSI